MSNTGFLTSRRTFKPEQVREEVVEILKDYRIYDKINLYTNGVSIFIEPKKSPGSGVEFWFMSRRKLEFRHPRTDWSSWIMCVIQNELAVLYNGTISDEGIEDRWKGVRNKYPTYGEYTEKMISHMVGIMPDSVVSICRNLRLSMEGE